MAAVSFRLNQCFPYPKVKWDLIHMAYQAFPDIAPSSPHYSLCGHHDGSCWYQTGCVLSQSPLLTQHTHPTWDAHPLVHEFLWVCAHVFFPVSNSGFASSLKFLLISAELCGCLFSCALRTSYMFSCYGIDKLVFKKKKMLSVFLTRSQVPSSVFSVHSWSQYTGIY